MIQAPQNSKPKAFSARTATRSTSFTPTQHPARDTVSFSRSPHAPIQFGMSGPIRWLHSRIKELEAHTGYSDVRHLQYTMFIALDSGDEPDLFNKAKQLLIQKKAPLIVQAKEDSYFLAHETKGKNLRGYNLTGVTIYPEEANHGRIDGREDIDITVFERTVFENDLTDTVFEETRFNGASFNKAWGKGTRFIRCVFDNETPYSFSKIKKPIFTDCIYSDPSLIGSLFYDQHWYAAKFPKTD